MGEMFDYDFSGWATRNDIKCSDGRTIKRDAFAEDDGKIVPLVDTFDHLEFTNVIGEVLLCNRPEGVYAYGKFNDTLEGRQAKIKVRIGELSSLGIYANNVKHTDGLNVVYGSIKAVSLVTDPSNPGAVIDYVARKHPIDLDHITDDQAIKATIEMWSDMYEVLGEKPDFSSRNSFKERWLNANGYVSTYPGMSRVTSDCFLCECALVKYRKSGYRLPKCSYCPIHWPGDQIHPTIKCVSDSLDYRLSPLPDILKHLKDKDNRRFKN